MKKRLKTIVVDLMPLLPGGDNGGAKIFILVLLKHLASMVPTTQFILLVSTATYPEIQALEKENVSCLPQATPCSSIQRGKGYLLRLPLPKFLGRVLYRLYHRLKKRGADPCLTTLDADLVFCPFTVPTYDFKSTIPIVSVVYDLQHQTYPQFFSKAVFLHREATFQKACECATAIATISEYSRQAVLKSSRLKPSQVKTIYLQMGERFGKRMSAEEEGMFVASLEAKYQLHAQSYLLYPANYWTHKNHEKLILAFEIATEHLPAKTQLVFTGADSERQAFLKAMVVERRLNDRIVFAGYVTNAELGTLLNHSAAVIFPSLYEGFGLPVIEAMTAGIPVACSNVTALPEIVADAALLFNPNNVEEMADTIGVLINDAVVRARLIALGKDRAYHFSSVAQMAEEYWRLFEEVLLDTQS